jgi:hypothetical protein
MLESMFSFQMKYLPSQGSKAFASNTSDSTPKGTPLEDTLLEVPVNEEVNSAGPEVG